MDIVIKIALTTMLFSLGLVVMLGFMAASIKDEKGPYMSACYKALRRWCAISMLMAFASLITMMIAIVWR